MKDIQSGSVYHASEDPIENETKISIVWPVVFYGFLICAAVSYMC